MAVKNRHEANKETYAFRAMGQKIPPPKPGKVLGGLVYDQVVLDDAWGTFVGLQSPPPLPPVPPPLIPTELSLRQQIIAACTEYKDAGRSQTSLAIYGPIGIDGKWHQAGNTACHAALLYETPGVCKKHVAYLLSITPQGRLVKKNRVADIAYYAWLLGPESPYRSIVKDFNPDPEFALDYGIVVGDLDTAPNNVVYHFFIATRLIYEACYGKIWHDFVKEGLHPVMAFLATYTISMSGKGPSHCAFPPANVLEAWLVNFANGTPARVDKDTYYSSRYHGGADTTWGPLPSTCKLTYIAGPCCWDEWAPNHDVALWTQTPHYAYDPRNGFGATAVADRKPSRINFRPKDRESGIKILLAEQERLFGR